MEYDFSPLLGPGICAVTRLLATNKTKKWGIKFPTQYLDDSIIIGLPEATVVTIVDGYYYSKLILKMESDKDIFKSLSIARMYDDGDVEELSAATDLVAYIEMELEKDDSGGRLNKDDIGLLIDGYKEYRKIEGEDV